MGKMKNYPCRRCLRFKCKDFMVLTKSGYPDRLCLACDERDRLKQAQFAKERKERATQ